MKTEKLDSSLGTSCKNIKGLSGLCEAVFKRKFNKNQSKSKWNVRPLDNKFLD